MTIKRKVGRLCRVLMLAASVTALSVSIAQPQDLQALNDRILENPQDAELNLRYARAAEAQGELRLALAAYERVMINNPDNEEARRGYERIRRALEPPFTTTRIETGVRWDSNVLNSGFVEEEAHSFYAEATIIDERQVGGRRWRTIGNFEGEITPEFDQLDHAYAGVQAGPLFYVAPHVAAIPAIGGAVATLDGTFYFGDLNASVTVEGKKDGLSYWGRARAGWRDYSDDATAEEGVYGELQGGLTVPRIASESDALVAMSWVRWSDIEGSTFNFFSGQVTPGEYVEVGLDIAYNFQVNDHVALTAGAMVRDRQYTSTTTPGGDDRHDTYVVPEAGVRFENFMPCECAVELMYRHRDNNSNDSAFEFDADQVSLALITRF